MNVTFYIYHHYYKIGVEMPFPIPKSNGKVVDMDPEVAFPRRAPFTNMV